MTIKTGDRFPATMVTLVTADGTRTVETSEFLAGRLVVLFAVPGAFTPTCSEKHLPGYIAHADQFAARGVDEVVCLAVNDPFVMKAWAKTSGAEGKLTMLADGSGLLTKALGLELDLVARGLGVRADRFAMIVEDGVVTMLAVEPPGGFGVSAAEAVLEKLPAKP